MRYSADRSVCAVMLAIMFLNSVLTNEEVSCSFCTHLILAFRYCCAYTTLRENLGINLNNVDNFCSRDRNLRAVRVKDLTKFEIFCSQPFQLVEEPYALAMRQLNCQLADSRLCPRVGQLYQLVFRQVQLMVSLDRCRLLDVACLSRFTVSDLSR
jgi:hypothetical protein